MFCLVLDSVPSAFLLTITDLAQHFGKLMFVKTCHINNEDGFTELTQTLYGLPQCRHVLFYFKVCLILNRSSCI